MDPDEIPDFLAYLQRGYALSQQLLEPSDAQLTADALEAYGAQRGGSFPAAEDASGPGQLPPQPQGGLYALGTAAISANDIDNPEGFYDDSAPDPAAQDPNPYLTLVASLPGAQTLASLAANGSEHPPPGGVTQVGQSIGGPPAPNPPLGGAFGPAAQMWRPPAPKLPSAQDQDAAKAILLGQGRTAYASYTDPTLDALANTAQGRAVAPGEPQPDLGPWKFAVGRGDQADQRSSRELDSLRQILSDPDIEGYRRDVYADSAGHPTVGIGHKVLPGDRLKIGDKVDDSQVDAFFQSDGNAALAAAHRQANEAGIDDPAFVPALASVNFQVGQYWRHIFPTTWKYIIEGRYEDAARELGRDEWARETPSRVAAFQAALRALPPKANR